MSVSGGIGFALLVSLLWAPVPLPRPAGVPDIMGTTPTAGAEREIRGPEWAEGAALDRSSLSLSPTPPRRPIQQRALAMSERRLGSGEMVCRDPRLKGRLVPVVTGRLSGCAIPEPVQVTHVSGIRLSQPATLDCITARSFANWVTGVADVAASDLLGSPLREVWVMGSYSCRTRNSRPGAKLSEHAKGRAIDVGGVTLANGRKITVLSNWNTGTSGKFLRRIWRRACGTFKTVLGPDGDRFHQDHLHLDSASRRSTFCR